MTLNRRYFLKSLLLLSAACTSKKIYATTQSYVSIKDFGAVGDGITDDTVAIQKALNAFSDIGGTVTIPNGMRCVVGELWIGKGVTFQGSNHQPGWDENLTTQYKNYGSVLLLKPNSTIHVQAGSSLKKCTILPNGMAFPQLNPNNWTGTAVTTEGDDAHVEQCMILGFGQAVMAMGHKRPRIKNVYFDCVNGIHVGDCWDTGVVQDCHSWSFATVANYGKTGYTDLRPGTAYYFGKGGDLRAVNNFSYGYYRGTYIDSCNGITILNMGNDTDPKNHPGSIGISIVGSAESVRLIDCQTAAYDNAAIYIDITNKAPVHIQNHNAWGYMQHGVLIKNGSAILNNCGYSTMQNGISPLSASSVVTVTNCNFSNVWGYVFNAGSSGAKFILDNNTFSDLTNSPASGLTYVTVTSANDLMIDSSFNLIMVNGSTAINTIKHAYPNRIITLMFNNECDINNEYDAEGGIRLNNKTKFHATLGSTLTLIGTDQKRWREVSRSF